MQGINMPVMDKSNLKQSLDVVDQWVEEGRERIKRKIERRYKGSVGSFAPRTSEKCCVCSYFITERHHVLPKGRGVKNECFDLCPNHHSFTHGVISALASKDMKIIDSWLNIDREFKEFFNNIYLPKLKELLQIRKNRKGGKNDTA